MKSCLKKARDGFLILLLGFSLGYSEEIRNEAVELGEVVVMAPEDKGKVLPDVQGTRIYSGKKTSVIEVQEGPAIVNNNFRQVLQKTPGLLLSEESTPLFSVGYRGLDPHRAQFTQVLKDGIPIHADMFGYPEAYYVPPVQVLDHIDFIRGGAALMYGPQPGGALNFVTKDPYLDSPFTFFTENAFGSHNLFSNYTSISGTKGVFGYYSYFNYRQSDGFRDFNSDYDLWYGGSKFTIDQDDTTRWTIAFDLYEEEHGEPGGLTQADFSLNPSKSTRRFDRFELDRYAGSIGYHKELSNFTLVEIKGFGGYYERASWRQRGGKFGLEPSGPDAATNDIENQKFYTGGVDARARHEYDAFGFTDHAFSGGLLYYHSTSPREDKRGAAPNAQDGTIRKDSDREMDYVSVFFENMFKLNRFSVTPGVRLENIWQGVEENVNVDKTSSGTTLADESEYDFVPLFGLGSVYELTPVVDVYGNVSQAYRPKIFTQAVPTGSGQIVNSDLEEGHAWQADIGLRGKPLPYTFFDVSYFYMEFDDQIGSVGTTGVVVQNVGDARHHGIELATEFDVLGWWDGWKDTDLSETIGIVNLFFNMMILDAEFTGGPSEGKTPQYAPDHILRGGIEYLFKDKVKVRLGGTFVDDHFANDSNSAEFFIPSYQVWDLTAEVKVYKDVLSLFGGVNNLFDESYFARVRSDGIDPADGRNYYGGAKIRW